MKLSSGPWPREGDEFAQCAASSAPNAIPSPVRRGGRGLRNLECKLTQIVHGPGPRIFAGLARSQVYHMRRRLHWDASVYVTTFQPLARAWLPRLHPCVRSLFCFSAPANEYFCQKKSSGFFPPLLGLKITQAAFIAHPAYPCGTLYSQAIGIRDHSFATTDQLTCLVKAGGNRG